MFTTEPSVRGLRPMFLNGHGIGYDKHRDNNEHLYTDICRNPYKQGFKCGDLFPHGDENWDKGPPVMIVGTRIRFMPSAS